MRDLMRAAMFVTYAFLIASGLIFGCVLPTIYFQVTLIDLGLDTQFLRKIWPLAAISGGLWIFLTFLLWLSGRKRQVTNIYMKEERRVIE